MVRPGPREEVEGPASKAWIDPSEREGVGHMILSPILACSVVDITKLDGDEG